MMDAHPNPRPIDQAPCDGTMLRLWVRYPEGGSWTPLDDARESWTVGFNNRDNTEDDRWQVVGWCWSHDHLVEASSDVEILGWLPFHGEAAHPGQTANPAEGAAGQRDNEPLKTDDTGCITKRFVIFNRPGMAPEKKGGWLKDEYLIAFLREVMLLDCWTPGFRATVLELTWNNDLWASSASEYLSAHDYAIGPRRARKAWREAREKHERIYKSAPSMPLGQEIATYHVRTSTFPPPAAREDRVRLAVEALEPLARLELPKRPVGNAGAYSILHKDIQRAADALAALKSTAEEQAEL
nr:hypothetical protein [uncultured Brevundimonas sp.]